MIQDLIISIVAAFVLTQFGKILTEFEKIKKFEWRMLLQNGGMPSSHTASVIALTVGIFFETGISEIFMVCVVLSIIVMNDAVKVRRLTGEEAQVINKLMEMENVQHKKLIERVGHTPAQVFVGFILGVIIPLVVYAI
jgi:uncharacterized protein